MGPRTGLDGRKISSPSGFDPGPFSPWSVAIPTELPGPHFNSYDGEISRRRWEKSIKRDFKVKDSEGRRIIE